MAVGGRNPDCPDYGSPQSSASQGADGWCCLARVVTVAQCRKKRGEHVGQAPGDGLLALVRERFGFVQLLE
jgi:hypothetical protein